MELPPRADDLTDAFTHPLPGSQGAALIDVMNCRMIRLSDNRGNGPFLTDRVRVGQINKENSPPRSFKVIARGLHPASVMIVARRYIGYSADSVMVC